MTLLTPPVIRHVSDLTTKWLSQALNHDIVNFNVDRTGVGNIGAVYRIHLDYGTRTESGPESLVLKIAAQDEASRKTALELGLYESEVRFYNEIAPSLGGTMVAQCHHAAFDKESGYFHLLLTDCRSATTLDDLVGATIEQARLAAAELGRLHGVSLREISEENALPWLTKGRPLKRSQTQELYNEFLRHHGDRLSPEHRALGQGFVDNIESWYKALYASCAILGLVHGDYRLDNMLFGRDGEHTLTLVDWQTCLFGPIFLDLSFFLGMCLTTEARRVHSDELIRIYHAALAKNAPERITIEQCYDGVRMGSYLGIQQAIMAATMLERTERGDDLFVAMFQRHCEMILDMKALDIIPTPNPPAPLIPEDSDEYAHPHGTDPLHNESWYFDVTDPEQEVGVWVRLGVTPNQPGSWYHALLCGPNLPTVGVIDFEAAHPGSSLVVHTDKYHATHVAEKPLQTYRITLRGKGEAFDDPSSILRGEHGRPVTVKMDLVFETDGKPYKWRVLTRYEIPCKVTGTFTWDDQTVTFTDARGQRDHSWGVRNWWNADWIWSAFHLDDGTHLHNVHLRPHGQRDFGTGYVQKKDEFFVELTDTYGTEVMASNGLGGPTTIKMAPLPLTLHITPRGHAPLRLDATDGKVAMFPRSWAECTTNDGRKGVGWIEWNLN